LNIFPTLFMSFTKFNTLPCMYRIIRSIKEWPECHLKCRCCVYTFPFHQNQYRIQT
jgi:hypothetical protein